MDNPKFKLPKSKSIIANTIKYDDNKHNLDKLKYNMKWLPQRQNVVFRDNLYNKARNERYAQWLLRPHMT